MFLNQDIDHVSILIHGPPQIMSLSLDGHEELVQVPDVAQLSFSAPEVAGVVWTELLTPLSDGLIGDHDSSLCQEFLDVTEAQGESVIQPYSVADDFRREAVSVIATSIGFHQPSVGKPGSS
jgi:hypothetical protein